MIRNRPAALRYGGLLALGAVVRAGALLSLVPLLAALFSADSRTALPWTLALAALTGAGWLVDYLAAGSGFRIGFDLLTSVEDRVVERLARVPLGWLDAERRAAARRVLTSSGREVVQAIAYLVTPAVNALLTPALLGLGLLAIAPPVGVVALASVPVLLAALWASGRFLRAADDAYAASAQEVGERIVELAQSQAALRAAGRAGSDGTAIGRALAGHRRAALRLVGFGIPGQVLFGVATQVVLIGLAATAVLQGLGAPEVVALLVVAVRFVEPFTALAELAPAVQAARATYTRLRALLEAPQLEGDDATPDPDAPAVELRGVRFGYGDGRDVLDGVSLTVEHGTTVAVVGPSGSGKSTLLALIARFHDVRDGSVRVAGRDVRAYDPATLMARLGIVFQDVYLFDATLRDNVRLGSPHATPAQLDRAARDAQLQEVIDRLPAGWETRVGERGAALSGGERQRVSIARALLKDAPLLLLDEATAALDTANERAVVAALEAAGRTTVIVAHRLTTIARADLIVFLDGGRVVESGTLAELLALDGRFAGYWRRREQAGEWTLTP